MSSVVDEVERDLYQKSIDAQYDYLNYVRKTWGKKFCDETMNKILDKTNYLYFLFDPNHKEIFLCPQDQITIKNMYRELSLAIHPDKCAAVWATSLFTYLNELYTKKDVEGIKKMHEYYTLHKNLEGYLDAQVKLAELANLAEQAKLDKDVQDPTAADPNISKEKQVENWKHQLWYLWAKDASIRSIFITKEEFEAKEAHAKAMEEVYKRYQS